MGVARHVLLWGSQNRWLESQFRRRHFARKAVSRFMPGEDADSALREAQTLAAQRVGTVLTELGENVTSAAEADAVVEHYLGVLDRIRDLEMDTHVSVKLTQLGLDIDRDATAHRLDQLIRHAASHGGVLWVDMEASSYVDATLQLYKRARAAHDNVALCLQSYLHRTPTDLEELLAIGATIRLVKGAYQEPPDVALARKADVDAAYLRQAVRLVEHASTGVGGKPGIATHDTALLRRLTDVVRARGLDPAAYEVQMLYGIRRAEQLRLADAGAPVRVLISYGEAWFPWYMRRLAERPANVGFVVRSMLMG